MNKYIFKFKGLLFTTVTIRSIGALMQVFVALLIRNIVDTAVSGNLSAFYKISIFSLVYFILMGANDYLTGASQAVYLRKTLNYLREDIFKGVMNKNHSDFTSSDTASYISNLTNDINLIENNYIIPYLMMIGDIVIFIGTVFVLLYINPWVTLVLFITGALMLIVPMLFSKPLSHRQNTLSENLNFFTQNIKDIFAGYEVIKSYDIEKESSSEFKQKNLELSKSKFKSLHLTAIANAVSLILAIGCQISGTIVGGFFLINGSITVGSLIAILNLGNGVSGPIMWIIQKATMIKGMSEVNEKLLTIIKQGEVPDNREPLKVFNDKISINDLSFSYSDDKIILDNLHFKFEKNKKYALVGESGCGKTTLIKILLGYYPNYTGNVQIDNSEIKDINSNSIGKFMSVIHQNVYMFNKDIRENITLSKDFTNEELNHALNVSGVNKFLSNLTQGINTSVGENGSNLSGGQKQRIAIARALIRKTPLLILDEGTSALDLKTASDIEQTLLTQDDLTILTITHKLDKEMLSKYDSILFMKNGKISEVGDFKTLKSLNGDFAKLLNTNVS
ncbi:ABC transporter ATP-binding protein [uncultured Clostridium sp.]|uniref:ABC transporter ATP-binding protein n=1 Tax=uncultured Clostridium sp. TaxID=59620 RepID=UPI002615BE31|nr:ABC transporter ATP-binding protein [uncultured Clostridium sp.]